tara:strand:+ start:2598 stop:4448 length:1851 start_codon:yes stop_codon:yes gene_type:complete
MARLSFIEQERIARNMTDGDILGEYEQKGSVLPPGIELEPSVLLGEMNGRTYVRDATEAAQTAANMPPGSTADQQVEKFRQGREGIQNLLAQGGPQGGGMPPQGAMPPEAAMQAMGGMPPEGVQMAASGGVIGLQGGGSYTITPEQIAAIREQNQIPNLRPEYDDYGGVLGAGLNMLTGSRSLDELRDNKAKAAARMANLGLLGLSFASPVGAALRVGGLGLRGLGLMRSGALGAGKVGGLGGILGGAGRFFAGGKNVFDKAGRLRYKVPRKIDPGTNVNIPKGGQLDLFGQGGGLVPGTGIRMGMRDALPHILRRGAYPAAGAGYIGLQAAAAGDDRASAEEGGKTDEQIATEYAAALAAEQERLRNRGGYGGYGGYGSGYGSAVDGDMERAFMNRRDNLLRYEEWLRTGTTQEDELDKFLRERSEEISGRIDPERDRGDLLTELLGGSARAIDRQSRGGSAAETLADTASTITAMGEAQRARNEARDDAAFALGMIPAERAAARSRETVMPALDSAISELQQQLASLRGIDMQARASIQAAIASVRKANEFGVGDIGDIENLAAAMQYAELPQETIDALLTDFVGSITNRAAGEAQGYQMGGTNNPYAQYDFTP